MIKHPLIVIKVSTQYYESPKGQVVIKKTIKQMHRMSEGDWRPIEDELNNGADELVNLSMEGIGDLKDGLYSLHATYSFADPYFSEVDDVTYSFLPYDPNNKFTCPHCGTIYTTEPQREECMCDCHEQQRYENAAQALLAD